MYFVKHGSLTYIQKQKEEGSATSKTTTKAILLEVDTWVAEAVLWTPWKHAGELRATTECELIAINGDEFRQAVQGFPRCLIAASQYAESFVLELNDSRERQTDLHEHSEQPGTYPVSSPRF